jgi:hypothetical protein
MEIAISQDLEGTMLTKDSRLMEPIIAWPLDYLLNNNAWIGVQSYQDLAHINTLRSLEKISYKVRSRLKVNFRLVRQTIDSACQLRRSLLQLQMYIIH